MKNRITLALVCVLMALVLVFAGCAKDAAEVTEPTTEPTTETTEATEPTTEAPTDPPTEPPTEAPTEPQPINPLTGEVVESPLTDRFFCVTINNVKPALPHRGVVNADIYFEMFINDYCTRGLAMFADIKNAGSIGSIRSLRYNFTDIAQGYDAIVCHAGGSDSVMSDLKNSGVKNLNGNNMGGFYRDSGRKSSGYATEHTLFAYGDKLMAEAQKRGYRTTLDTEKDFGLHFTDDGTPAGGQKASKVTIDFILKGRSKVTTMVYDETLGGYVYQQYGKTMADDATGEKECFENVIVIVTTVTNKVASGNTYHVAELEGSGSGYFACGGQIISINWKRSGPNAPFSFTLSDGTPLEMGVGTSYIAIAPTTSNISWE